MAWAASAVGVASLGYGIFKSEKQKSEANKIAKNNKFVQERLPGEVQQATTLAAQNYINGMPGMDYARDQIKNNFAASQAAATNAASSGGDLLDTANKLNYNSNIASNQLAQQAAAYKANALGQYQNQLNTQAQWQDKLYQNNELQPYLRAANTAASLQGAANINEANAIDNGLVSAQTAIQNYQNQQKIDLQKANPNSGGAISYVPGVGGAVNAPFTSSANPYLGAAFDPASALANSKYYKFGS